MTKLTEKKLPLICLAIDTRSKIHRTDLMNYNMTLLTRNVIRSIFKREAILCRLGSIMTAGVCESTDSEVHKYFVL